MKRIHALRLLFLFPRASCIGSCLFRVYSFVVRGSCTSSQFPSPLIIGFRNNHAITYVCRRILSIGPYCTKKVTGLPKNSNMVFVASVNHSSSSDREVGYLSRPAPINAGGCSYKENIMPYFDISYTKNERTWYLSTCSVSPSVCVLAYQSAKRGRYVCVPKKVRRHPPTAPHQSVSGNASRTTTQSHLRLFLCWLSSSGFGAAHAPPLFRKRRGVEDSYMHAGPF